MPSQRGHSMRWSCRIVCFLALGIAAGAANAAPQVAAESSPAPTPAPVDANADALKRCFGLQRSEPAAAVALAESILAAAPLPVETEIKAQSCLGMASAIAGDLPRAIDAATRMEQLFDSQPLPPDIALRTLSNAGAILHAAGQVHRALVLYERAARAAEADEVPLVQVKSLINIAVIRAESLDDPEGADALFRRALELSQVIGDRDVLLYFNHARNLVRLGRDEEALAMLDLADAEADSTANTMFGLRIDAERAGVLHRLARPGDAHARLLDVIAKQETLSDPAGESASLVLLSHVQRDGGDAAAALASAEQAEVLVQGDAFVRERIDAMQAQIAALRALGRPEAALALAEREFALTLGSVKQQNLEGLATLQARMQDADSAREMERLRHEAELQRLGSERARIARNWALAALAVLALAVLAFIVYERGINRRLQRLSTVDSLTGLVNRRAATQRLVMARNDAAALSSARSLILLVDIDHFKNVNDRYGHAVGDLILTELSARLKTGCRPDDIVSRWGGEEFLIACGSVTLDQARAVAERLRVAISDTAFRLPDGQKVQVTISLGFAPYPFFAGVEDHGEQPWQDAIRLADRALYAAKHSGRNAWVGLWGQAEDGGDIDAVLSDPVAAEAARRIAIVASREAQWAGDVASHRPS